MAKRGLPEHIYKSIFGNVKKLLAMYEVECNMYEDNYWRFRCTYFGDLLFDYYPKNRKIAIFEDGRTKWETLDIKYMKHLEKILDDFVFTNKIDVDVI